MLARTLVIRTATLRPIEKAVRNSKFFRPLVARFIAGDTLEEALNACEGLLHKDLLVTLDYLGENTHSEAEAASATDTFISSLVRIDRVERVKRFQAEGGHGRSLGPGAPSIEPMNISIKLTQCGLDLGDKVAEMNYRRIMVAAESSDNFVRVDMEGSDYTQRTLDLVLRVREDHPQTGTVLQSYLRRNDEDVELVVERQLRVRLVKGAYLEPASLAYPEKSKVDEAFVRQGKRLLRNGFYPALATHDEKIIKELCDYATAEGIHPGRFEFQMLYGIRRDLQEGLREQGYNVRIYVPFGDQWYPYFTRRLAERPANALFILRSLLRG